MVELKKNFYIKIYFKTILICKYILINSSENVNTYMKLAVNLL